MRKLQVETALLLRDEHVAMDVPPVAAGVKRPRRQHRSVADIENHHCGFCGRYGHKQPSCPKANALLDAQASGKAVVHRTKELTGKDRQLAALVQKLKYETRTWTEFHSIKIVDNGNVIDLDCPNQKWMSSNTAYIKNGFIYTSFPTGKLYLNYQGLLEDDEGNLLVPDHDMLNEYYEYAIKQRVLENAVMNGEAVTQMQFQIVEQRLKAARNNANTLVNTPDFGELRKIWETNRKAQYHNYWNMFKRY